MGMDRVERGGKITRKIHKVSRVDERTSGYIGKKIKERR